MLLKYMIKILKYIEFKMNYYCESILSTMKKCLHVLKMKQIFDPTICKI